MVTSILHFIIKVYFCNIILQHILFYLLIIYVVKTSKEKDLEVQK